MTLEAGDIDLLCQRLTAWFAPELRYVVALSGGVDSAVVARAAVAAGADVVAVTARSAALSEVERDDARRLADSLDIRHAWVDAGETRDANYQRNDARRCYYCKSRLYAAIAADHPDRVILSGTNRDDLGDYRPGLAAADEARVRSPLVELAMGKQQVRQLAHHWALHVADKPASPCLASRIAHGVAVTDALLARIERAERLLRELGLVEFRVRAHADDLARIEVPSAEFGRLATGATRDRLVRELRELGFRYVTLDLEGFRTGSLHPLVAIANPITSSAAGR